MDHPAPLGRATRDRATAVRRRGVGLSRPITARRAPRGHRMRVRGTAPPMGIPFTCRRGVVRRARLERAMRALATVGGVEVVGLIAFVIVRH